MSDRKPWKKKTPMEAIQHLRKKLANEIAKYETSLDKMRGDLRSMDQAITVMEGVDMTDDYGPRGRFGGGVE